MTPLPAPSCPQDNPQPLHHRWGVQRQFLQEPEGFTSFSLGMWGHPPPPATPSSPPGPPPPPVGSPSHPGAVSGSWVTPASLGNAMSRAPRSPPGLGSPACVCGDNPNPQHEDRVSRARGHGVTRSPRRTPWLGAGGTQQPPHTAGGTEGWSCCRPAPLPRRGRRHRAQDVSSHPGALGARRTGTWVGTRGSPGLGAGAGGGQRAPAGDMAGSC